MSAFVNFDLRTDFKLPTNCTIFDSASYYRLGWAGLYTRDLPTQPRDPCPLDCRYAGKECQKAHYKEHRGFCKAVREENEKKKKNGAP